MFSLNPSLVVGLEVGTCIYLNDCKSHITPLDANHCPGSVMFYFEKDSGENVLYTGDFRYHPTILDPLGGNARIDELYLDNTFHKTAFTFPPQQGASDAVVTICKNFPTAKILIGIDNLGKEDLLLDITAGLRMNGDIYPVF
jgi:DNA cross-link repair 1B protein